MGEMTEDIIKGKCCSYCDQYFKNLKTGGIYAHDYPVVCWDCWKELSPKEKSKLHKADVKTL